MHDGRSQNHRLVQVLMPALNEELSIRDVVVAYSSNASVARVVLVDNNSTDETANLAKDSGAFVISCHSPGFGAALKTGIVDWLKSHSDLPLLIVESDGTFAAEDVNKFLAYYEDADVVIGSRTSRSLVWDGSYMPFWVRIGNWFVAKMAEFLYNGPSLTDIGCTAKLIKPGSFSIEDIRQLTDKSHFNEQFMVCLLESKLKIIEIPVNYKPRVGLSKITGGNTLTTLRLGILMIIDLLLYRLMRIRIR